MTYVRKPKIFKVSFEEPHPLSGLSLCTHPLSVREFAAFGLKLAEAADVERAGTDIEQLKGIASILDSLDDVRAMFADKLISWDMEEEDGTPTPATLDGVLLLDDGEFYGIVEEWLSAIGGVDADTGKDSGSGETVPELLPLMEPLSPSQAS